MGKVIHEFSVGFSTPDFDIEPRKLLLQALGEWAQPVHGNRNGLVVGA
jgi:hypothetical protein